MTFRPRPSLELVVVPLLGVLFSVMFAAQSFYLSAVLGDPTTWRNAFSNTLPRWLLFSFLAPLVGWLVNRQPVEGGRVPSRLALHLAAGTAFSVLHCALMGTYFAVFHLYPPQETLLGAIRRLLLVHFGINLVIYVTIAAAYHVLRYFRELRKRELLAASLRASLTEARLAALRAQLNPHFLFNTLNATSTLALTGQHDEVVHTLNRLGDLLRVSLDQDLPQEIPLERELEILSAYLDIQRIRFGDRIAIDLEIEPGTLGALVPSMVLQPIVENAFEHGIARCTAPGRVTIRAGRQEGRLRLRVEDTGPGFNGAGRSGGGPSGGIGLTNTRARLEQLYGDGGRLGQGNLAPAGAFVEVWLPLRTPESSS